MLKRRWIPDQTRDSKNRCIKDGFWSSLGERNSRVDRAALRIIGWRQSRAITFLSLLTRIIVDARARRRPESISFLAACFSPVCQGLSLSLSPRRMREIAAGYTHARQSYAYRWRWRWWRFITSNGNSCSFIALPLSPSKEAHLWPSSREERRESV